MLNTEAITTIIDQGFSVTPRRVYLFTEINDESTAKVVKAIHVLNDLSKEPIQLYIMSPGGETNGMFAMYDEIMKSEAPVHTVGLGEVCSAALLILACGKVRSVTENTWALHHQMSYATSGTEQAVEVEAAAAKRQASNRYRLLALHSLKKASWWEQQTKMTGDIWMSAEELLEVGVVDSIWKNPKVKAVKKRPRKVPQKKVLLPQSEAVNVQ